MWCCSVVECGAGVLCVLVLCGAAFLVLSADTGVLVLLLGWLVFVVSVVVVELVVVFLFMWSRLMSMKSSRKRKMLI